MTAGATCRQIFYLIFCRSVWYFPLRLESPLYVEVVFNQIAPDYLEGLLLVMPGETLHEQVVVSRLSQSQVESETGGVISVMVAGEP